MDKVDGENNKFEVRIDSQYPFRMVIIEKSKYSQLVYENQPGIVIESMEEVSQL
jgi:hypothetical protein